MDTGLFSNVTVPIVISWLSLVGAVIISLKIMSVARNAEARLKLELASRIRELDALKLKLKTPAVDIDMARKSEEAKQEIERLRLEVDRKDSELKARKEDIGALNRQMNDLEVRYKTLVSEMRSRDSQVHTDQGQTLHLAGQLSELEAKYKTQPAEVQAKDAELEASREEVSRLTRKISDLEAVKSLARQAGATDDRGNAAEADLGAVADSLEETKKKVSELRIRIKESGMKLALLDEKTIQSVEAIAQFAGGKDFEEFRKTVHLDEIIQRYEDQIKALNIRALENKKDI